MWPVSSFRCQAVPGDQQRSGSLKIVFKQSKF